MQRRSAHVAGAPADPLVQGQQVGREVSAHSPALPLDAVHLLVHVVVDRVTRPLGTALWEDGVATRSPALAGGWYAAPAGTQRRAFTTRYTQTFGSAPPAIAPLAYDSTALAAVLARSPALFADNRMIDPMGFNGVDGIFRLHPSGNVERGLAVFEVSASGNTLLDAAPVSFGTPRTN